MVGVIFHDVPLVTDTGVPLPLKESPKCPTVERQMLVDGEEIEEAEEEGIRALKRRKRHKAFTSALMNMSSEATQSAELLDLPTVRAPKEVREGSSHTRAF